MRAIPQLNPEETGSPFKTLATHIDDYCLQKVQHKLVRRHLPGTGACDSENRSVERSRPGCSLHQGASSWNDAPAGAAPGPKLELGFTSLNAGSLLPTALDKSIQ